MGSLLYLKGYGFLSIAFSDDQAGCDDLSGIDFEDDDQDFPQHEMVEVKMEVEESKPLIRFAFRYFTCLLLI